MMAKKDATIEQLKDKAEDNVVELTKAAITHGLVDWMIVEFQAAIVVLRSYAIKQGEQDQTHKKPKDEKVH